MARPVRKVTRFPELAGLAEVAGLADVSRTRAGQLAAHPWFPPPVQRLAMGPVWLKANVKTFLAIPRPAGRSPKTTPMEHPEFRWHVLSECPDEGPCPIHGLNRVADDDITCHACEECGVFTLRPGSSGVVAHCVGCQHEWVVVHPPGGAIWGPEI